MLGLAFFVSLALIAEEKKAKEVWTDPTDATLPVDFKIQGEYVGEITGGGKIGCQVIALGKRHFQAVVLPGGLPGDGWDGKNKILMDGKLEGDKVTFTPATGKRKYLAQVPEEFSATVKFPPAGQKDYTATIAGDTLNGKTEDGKTFELKKIEPQEPDARREAAGRRRRALRRHQHRRMERRPARQGDRLAQHRRQGHRHQEEVQQLHRPRRIPAALPSRRAAARAAATAASTRCDHYEVQILDSFGLDGKNNECGGIYTKAAPKLNMCLPPLIWQTYDVEFTNAVREDGKKTKNARATLKHNGVSSTTTSRSTARPAATATTGRHARPASCCRATAIRCSSATSGSWKRNNLRQMRSLTKPPRSGRVVRNQSILAISPGTRRYSCSIARPNHC